VASADGTSLTPYEDTALTVGGEINKLAFNVAMGRDFAGVFLNRSRRSLNNQRVGISLSASR